MDAPQTNQVTISKDATFWYVVEQSLRYLVNEGMLSGSSQGVIRGVLAEISSALDANESST